MIDVALYISYILIGVCLATAVVMPLIKVFGDPKSLKSMLIGLGGLALVILIGFLIAKGNPVAGASAGTSKAVGAGLITMYILAIVAILGIVVSEVKTLVK